LRGLLPLAMLLIAAAGWFVWFLAN
jgi:hypothetical protein